MSALLLALATLMLIVPTFFAGREFVHHTGGRAELDPETIGIIVGLSFVAFIGITLILLLPDGGLTLLVILLLFLLLWVMLG